MRPAFLDQHPVLRVTRIRHGIVRATPEGEAINDPTDAATVYRYPVIEQAHEGYASHPRVLCTGDYALARVALYLDASSVATVALDGAMIRLDVAAAPTAEDSPAVRLASGARIEVLEQRAEAARVRFRGSLLEAEGYVDTARIGNVFRPADFSERTWNAELREGARFLDAPRGRTIAMLERNPNQAERDVAASADYPRYAGPHVATTIGPPREGHTLVRFSIADARVVGWVDSRSVTAVSERSGPRPAWGGLGLREPRFNRPVTLPAETRLLDGRNGRWIGVLNREAELECLEACDTRSPRVEVPTCVGTVRLWTAPPI